MVLHISGALVQPIRHAIQAATPLVALPRRRAAVADLGPGVLHIVSGNSLAGVERHVLLLAEAQMAIGMRVHVAFRRGGWLQDQLQGSEIPHTALSLRGTVDAVSLARIAGIVRRERLQVVHGHLIRGMFYAMAAGKLTGRASVGTDHMFHPNWTMRHLKRLVVPAETIRDAAPDIVAREHIAVVPFGVDMEELEEGASRAREERLTWNVPHGEPVILLLGRITAAKGHDVLLRALAQLQPGDRPWVVFAGPEEPAWGKHIRSLAAELDVADRTRFLGPRSNVGAVLEAADLFVLPSRMEASPLALLEAMALGRPVVAAAVGGIPDVISHGFNGLLVPPEDPERLAEAIRDMLDDTRARQRMGARARVTALASYTPRAMAEATRDVYLEALGRNGRRA